MSFKQTCRPRAPADISSTFLQPFLSKGPDQGRNIFLPLSGHEMTVVDVGTAMNASLDDDLVNQLRDSQLARKSP